MSASKAKGGKKEEESKAPKALKAETLPAAAAKAAADPEDADASNFALTAVNTGDYEERIAKGTLTAVYNPVVMAEADLLALMPDEVSAMGAKGRGMINGVSPAVLMKQYLLALLGARREANPVPLIYCGVLSVAVAYTVSREWADEYGEVPSPHMFSSFEISGRKKRVALKDGASDEWVEKSNMNAAALRIFGSMIVEAGTGSAFLAQLKVEAGTIFTPPTGDKARDKLMKEANAALSEADKAALVQFRKYGTTYANLVGSVFGGGTLDVKLYTDVADKLGVVYI